jgi:hypothetical protein
MNYIENLYQLKSWRLIMNKSNVVKLEIPKGFNLPQVEVTREEYRMIRLKAAMYTGGNIEKFLLQAAEQYVGVMKPIACCENGCNGIMNVTKSDQIHEFQIADKLHRLTLKGEPIYEFQACAKQVVDLQLSAEIEEVLDKEVFCRLNQRLELPTELEFDELLKISQERSG